MNKKIIAAEISSALLVLLYGYTAISKITGYPIFHHALAESPLIRQGAGIIAWLVILAEAVIVLLLFFPVTRRAGLYISFVLLILFTGYLIYMVLFAAKLPCGCGGVISKMSWKQHIFFNLFFLVVNVVGIWQWGVENGKLKIDSE